MLSMKRAEAKTGLFKWDLVNASKGHGFSISIRRTLKTNEIITAHTLWSSPLRKLRFWQTVDREGVVATWAETAPEQGMPDGEWKTAARRRLRLWIDEPRSCDCGMLKDESMPKKPIENSNT